MVVVPASAQGPVPPISLEAQKQRARLLAEYQKALYFELAHSQIIINTDDRQKRCWLVGLLKKWMYFGKRL